MGLLNVIRRMALREKLPIREIARRIGLSQNTIKKYLKAGTIEPKFNVPARSSKLDPYVEKLAAWLKREAAKSRKQRRTLKLLHRLIDGKPTDAPSIDTPVSLALKREPRANVERHDELRARDAGGRHAS